ncbi:MAG: ComEC/Rec2 family competence protein [Clostridia bacterium]|nr:ComEC/Rec2 family competence protein [Clostridia bacterium]
MDKRPLGFIGAVFFLTVLLFTRVGTEKALYILPVFLIAVFLIFLKQKKLKFFAVIAASVLCASALFSVAESTFHMNEVYFSGEDVTVEGAILEKPYIHNDKQYVVIKTDKVDGENVTIKVRINALDLPEDADFNSKVRLRANLYKVSGLDTSMSSLKSQNICLVGNCKANSFIVIGDAEKDLRYHLLSLRYRLVDTVYSLFPNDIGGFISGIVLGETDFLEDETMESFRITGTSHILVVSGLHVALWSGFFYKIFAVFFRKRLSAIISIAFLFFYMAFTGFTPSVIRAGTMMILNYVAVILREKPDSLNTLGISALVITACDPFSLYSVGTVFSFASVFGILLMHEYIYKKLNFMKIRNVLLRKITQTLTSLILVSLSAQIFTFPVSVLYNINFSLLSVVVNTLISLLSTISMVSGGFGAVILTFFSTSVIGRFSMSLSAVASKVILHIVKTFSCYSDMYISVSNLENYILVFLVLTLIFLLALSNRKNKSVIFAILMIPVFLVSYFVPDLYKSSFVEFSVIDVGQGLCVAFTNDEECVMFGCGGTFTANSNITNYLERGRIKSIEAVYLSVNESMAQMNEIMNIKEDFTIDSVVTSSECNFSYISKNSVSADYVKAEYFGGKMRVDFYTQEKSSFALVRTGDKRILINFYEKLNEENLPQGCIAPDIYVTMYGNTYVGDSSLIGKYIISSEYETSVPAAARDVHITMNDGNFIKPILV